MLALALAVVSCVEKENQGQPEATMKGMYYATAITEEPVVEISPGKSKTIGLIANADTLKGSVSDIKLTLSFKADPDAVPAYNSANGTSYSACPGSAYEFVSNEVMMPRYGVSSSTAKLKLSSAGLEDGVTYLLPLVIDKVAETDNWELSPTPYAYVVVKRAYVAPSAGTGKKDDPYNIYTVADLLSMADRLEENVKVYFRLQEDIDMTDVKWTPLNFASPYTYGIDFDGNGHTIDHFSCDFSNYPSFFGVLYGECHDVTFTNARLENQGTNACGILGAYCGTSGLPGVCRNVHVEGAVESLAGDRGVGGLFGRVHYGKVMDSSFKGQVTGAGGKTGVGGLVGWLNGTIERCWADAQVESNANYVGGLVGYENSAADNPISVIQDCWTSGSVKGPQRLGGIIGGIIKEKTEIRNCFTTSSVEATFAIGGIAGHCNLDKGSSVLPTDTEAAFVVENCIAWNEFIHATNTDGDEHYSSGAITGYTSTKVYLTDNYRKPDLDFTECASNSANVLYDMPNITPGSPLPKAAGTGTYNFPYHGKAAAAGSSISSVAQSLNWSQAVWDFSGDVPALKKAASGGSGDEDEDVNPGGQLPDFPESEFYN